MPPDDSTSVLPATSWLILLLAIAVVYCASLIWRSEYSLWENCLFAPTFMIGRILWRVNFTNDPPDELSHGAVMVANHRSSVDPFFVQLAARRRVHWMVAKEYCDHFLFGPFLRLLHVIPTNRSGMDTASTKKAIRLTREGRLVGMFPEGKINRGDTTLLPVRGGAAVVAIRSGVPMIPLLIEGSPFRGPVWSPIFMPAHVRITFGEPIPPPENSVEGDAEENANMLADSDAMILNWARQVVRLKGIPDYPVQLATKRRRRSARKS